MRDGENSTWLNDSYVGMLKGLSPERKKDIIAKLNQLVGIANDRPVKEFWDSFGGWESEETADEIIAGIRSSRNFSRITEGL